jgi:predicted O-methyltransferase YrrM
MSAEGTRVDDRHFRYIAERTRKEDDFLRQLKATAKEAGIPPIWISPEQASFMQILLKSAQAIHVLEVGTLAGYGAIQMARALPPDGRVVTIEIDTARADFAREWAEKEASGVKGRLEVLVRNANDVLATLDDRCFDAAFLDADKASYPIYLRHARRLVRPGGLILVDNAFAFGQLFDEQPTDKEALAVRAFNDHMAAQEDLHGVIVPLGDGLWVALNPSPHGA